MTGDELHDGAERGPGWRQKDETKTQYKFNSRPKNEHRLFCLDVETFPLA